MKNYVDAIALQEYTTKLVAKLKTLFPGTPTAAATVAAMTDHSKTYVYVGSETGYTAGDWYYWDGSAWTSGGPFQATSIITDTTLAVAGEAADAKATGDAIAAAKAAVLNAMAPAYSTSGTYAVGAYVNQNGAIYRCITPITTAEAWTAGHWVAVTLGADLEGQVSDLKTQMENELGIEFVTGWVRGRYPTSATDTNVDKTAPESSETYDCTYVDCEPGTVFYYTGKGSSSYRPWTWLKANGDIISRAPGTNSYTFDNEIITAPENTACVVFNCNITNGYTVVKGQLITERVSSLETRVAELESEVADNTTAISGITKAIDCEVVTGWQYGKYYPSGTSGTPVTNIDKTQPQDFNTYDCTYVDCVAGATFYYTGKGYAGGRPWVWLASNGDVINRATQGDNSWAYDNKKITAPENTACVVFNCNKSYGYLVTIGETPDNRLTRLEKDTDRFGILEKYNDRIDALTQMFTKDLCLLVYTDIHGDAENLERINTWKNDNKPVYVNDIYCLGDMIDDQATDTLDTLNAVPIWSPTLKVIGNHDVLVSGTLPGITAKQCYDKYIAPYISGWGVQQPTDAAEGGKSYYYKDYNNKIRVIVLDTYYYTSAQNTWFATVLEDARANNLAVIVAEHEDICTASEKQPLNSDYPFARKHDGYTGLQYRTYGDGGDYQTKRNAVDAFKANGGEFICWLSGHMHTDMTGYYEGEHGRQLSIVLANASKAQESSTRITGYCQDCFTYLAVDTATKYIYLLRIGIDTDKWFHKNLLMCYDYHALESGETDPGVNRVIEYR